MSQAVETDKTLQEKALVNIAEQKDDGTEKFSQSFEAEIEDPSFPTGSRDWSMTQLTSGGQERLYDPEEEKTFSATMYIKGIDASEASGIEDLFHTREFPSGSASRDTASSLSRKDLRIVFTVAAESIADAEAATTQGNAAYRMIMQNAEVISVDTDFEDNSLTVEFELKTNAFTPGGDPNVRKQSVEPGSSDNLIAVPAYNSIEGVSATEDYFDITSDTLKTTKQ